MKNFRAIGLLLTCFTFVAMFRFAARGETGWATFCATVIALEVASELYNARRRREGGGDDD